MESRATMPPLIESESRAWDPRFDGLLVAVVFGLALWRCAPSLAWQDSGSLVSAAWHMGIAHPPGEPAYLALARIAQLLPIGDIAFRVNLLSAVALALCVLPIAALSRSLAVELGFSPVVKRFAAVVAPLLVLLGFGAQLQGVRAELYSLCALLLTSALACAALTTSVRASAGVGLLVGLAACVHPLLTVATLPAIGIFLLLWERPTRRDLLVAGLSFSVAYGANAWLPLRALALPQRSWGIPDHPAALLDVLLARDFASNFGAEAPSLIHNLQLLFEESSRAGTPLLLLLSAVAGFAWSRGRLARALVVALPLWWVGNLLTMALQNKLYADNPDVLGYLLVGALPAAPLAALTLAVGLLGQPSWVLRAATCLLLTWVVLPQALDGHQADRSANFLPARFAYSQAAALPPGSVLLTSGNDTAFSWGYLQGVERRRADLTLIHRVLLGHPHEQARLLGIDAVAGAMIPGTGLPWIPALRDLPLDVHRAAGAQPPLFLELREQDLNSGLANSLQRHGVVEKLPGLKAQLREQESAYLHTVRRGLLTEMAQQNFAVDRHAGLLRAYYSAIQDARRELR